MVNASLNWASILGLGLILIWIPLYLIALIHVDWLTRREVEHRKKAPEWVVFAVTFCGRAFCLPFLAGILFFQGWRLDPILQFGMFLLVAGVIAEASKSSLSDHEQNRQLASAYRLGTDRSCTSAMTLRVQDRVWLWAVLHATLPLVILLRLHTADDHSLLLGDHCSNDCRGLIKWVGLPAGCFARRVAAR